MKKKHVYPTDMGTKRAVQAIILSFKSYVIVFATSDSAIIYAQR